MLVVAALLTAGRMMQAAPGSQPRAGSPPLVTAVSGPSVLERLGLTMETSVMGRTGVWGPPPEGPQPVVRNITYSANSPGPLQMTGADLYRLNCQACHQSDGNGALPEINSVVGPVQAISPQVMEDRMKRIGRPISPVFAQHLAADARKALMDRLKNGGKKMPAFGHLSAGETEAIVAYLELLANVPGAGQRQRVVPEQIVRVGELLVKGTCQTCHPATGHWPEPEELLEGDVPPLSLFASQRSMDQVIRKARYGAPAVMGRAMIPYRGRMPVFNYLKDEEVSAAYLYLQFYPPGAE